MQLSQLAEQRDILREQKRGLEAQIRDIESQLADNEAQILEIMENQGVDKLQVGKLSFSASTQTLPSIEDWDAFYEFIHENKAFHLLHRRVSTGAFTELAEAGELPPGTSSYTKTRLNMRKTN